MPFVLFASDASRLVLLADAARRSGCGLEWDDGLVVAWGPSLVEIIVFASEIVHRRAGFGALLPAVDRDSCVVCDESGW